MILLTSADSVIKTVVLGIKACNLPLPDEISSLRISYQKYLQVMQPNCNWLRGMDETIIEEKSTPSVRKRLLKIFQEDSSVLDDMDQKSVIENGKIDRKAREKLIAAYEAMKELAPEHRVLFDLFIEKVFCETSSVASGGSTSSAVGVIWANPHPAFDQNDLLEFLIHELTHNLLFLDEWINPHYLYDEIQRPNTWCQSAILQTKRPLDKVVHSIIVAAEIVLVRRQLLGEPVNPKAHPPSDEIVQAILRSIDEIHSLTQAHEFIHERIWQLLEITRRSVIGSGSNRSSMLPLHAAE